MTSAPFRHVISDAAVGQQEISAAMTPKGLRRKRLATLGKLSLSIVLVMALWLSLSSRNDVIGLAATTKIVPLFLALSVFFLGQAVAAWRLQRILIRLGRRIGYGAVLRIHLIGLWFGLMLPTGVGGDVAKAVLLRKLGGPGRGIRAVVLGRLFGLVALLITVAVLIPIYHLSFADPQPVYWLGAASLCSVIAFLLVVWFVGGNRTLSRLPKFVRLGILLCKDIRRFARASHQIALIISSLLVVLSVVLCFMFLAQAIGLTVRFSILLTVVPAVILAMHVPISYGGWGMRELGAVALFPLAGVSAEAGFLLSVLYGVVFIGAALPGMFLWHCPSAVSDREMGGSLKPKGSSEDVKNLHYRSSIQ